MDKYRSVALNSQVAAIPAGKRDLVELGDDSESRRQGDVGDSVGRVGVDVEQFDVRASIKIEKTCRDVGFGISMGQGLEGLP